MNAHETHNDDDELGDHLSQAISAVRDQPVPKDVRKHVLEAAASWTAASLSPRVRMRWYPMVAAGLAASLLLAAGLVAFHAATKDRTIGGQNDQFLAKRLEDSLQKVAAVSGGSGESHEDIDTVNPSIAAHAGLTLQYAKPSISAIVAENAPIIVTNGPGKPVHLGAWERSPDGHTSLHVWDWSRSPLSRVAMESDWFRSESVALSPDGKLLVRASGEIIDLESGERKPIDLGGAVYKVDNATRSRIGGIQFSPDGSRIALLVQLPHEEGFAIIEKTVIQLVEFPTGRVLCQFPAGQSYPQLRVAFSPDGKQVVAGELDKQILVHQWLVRRDTTTGEVLKRYEPVLEQQVTAVSLSPDGGYVAACQYQGDVLIWEADSGRLAHRIKTAFYESVGSYAPVNSLKFSPDSRLLAVSEDGVRVKLYDSATGRLVRELARIYASKDLRWSDDGKTLTAISEVALGDGGGSVFPRERYDVYPSVEEWDWQSGKLIRTLVAPLSGSLRRRALTGDAVVPASDDDQERPRADTNARADAKVLTPDEAVNNETDESVTVEFRVGSVALLTGDQPPGMPQHLEPIMLTADARLEKGGKFYVVLNGRLREYIWDLAIDPVKHFDGRTVQVTGTIRAVELRAEGTYYGIVALDPKQLRVVK